MHDVDKDPLLPKCFAEYTESHTEAKQWVVDSIRSLNQNWWNALSNGYDKVFNHTGVYRPYQEVNARRRMANLWLRDKLKRFG